MWMLQTAVQLGYIMLIKSLLTLLSIKLPSTDYLH
uniref:Uncharacterized protein n=1 Tax=Anguilla anguilla TaxID=7936 RepID=A0A0E9T8G0_ANGAN